MQRIRVWKRDPRDPDVSTEIHDLEADDARIIDGGILAVGIKNRPIYWIRSWDWVEIEYDPPTTPETP